MMIKVTPARVFELHIVLQSWNESNYDRVRRSHQILRYKRLRLTSLFTEVSAIAMSGGRFENKGIFTFVQDLIESG